MLPDQLARDELPSPEQEQQSGLRDVSLLFLSLTHPGVALPGPAVLPKRDAPYFWGMESPEKCGWGCLCDLTFHRNIF